MYRPRQRKFFTELLEPRYLLSTAAPVATPDLKLIPQTDPSDIQGFTPSQIATAYGFSDITLSGGIQGTGAGQTIAIVDAFNDPAIASDLATFDSQFDLAAPPKFTVVSQSGSTTELPVENADWDEEISLDVEWAHAMAPQANILLVETNSDNLNSLLAGVTYAAGAPNVAVVSMSWGSTEFSGETSYDTDFTTAAGHKGVSFVAASGDNGSFDGPDWPADSPDVLGVGGTSLTTSDSSGTYAGETAWSETTGGISSYEGEPAYQDNAQSTTFRTSPDVSYVGDPNTGVAVYDSISDQGYVGWIELGGTSAGAPQWAALIAIADQGRAIGHAGTLNGGSGTLPKLYDLYNDPTTYANAFNDITQGGFRHSQATVGYDLATGLGSPIASAIVSALETGTGGAKSGAPLTPVTEPPPHIHFPTRFVEVATDAVTAQPATLISPVTPAAHAAAISTPSTPTASSPAPSNGALPSVFSTTPLFADPAIADDILHAATRSSAANAQSSTPPALASSSQPRWQSPTFATLNTAFPASISPLATIPALSLLNSQNIAAQAWTEWSISAAAAAILVGIYRLERDQQKSALPRATEIPSLETQRRREIHF